MTDQLATLTTEGDVSIITLDDGKANVFSNAMISTIDQLLDEVPNDKGALLITGRQGLLSCGFALKPMTGGEAKDIIDMTVNGFTLLERISGS